VKSKQGDALVQKLTLKSTDQKVFTKVFSSFALYDGSTKVVEVPSSNYVKVGTSDYQLTFSGFSVLVPKDGYKDLTVKVNLYSSIDSAYRGSYGSVLSVPSNGIRAIDGAGVNQYAQTSGTRSFSVEQSEDELATLSLARDASSPKTSLFVSDSYGDVKDASVLVLALKAEKGRVKVTDLVVTSTGSATVDSVDLYDGSTKLASTGFATNTATFSDLSDLYVEKDQTKLLTLKVNVSGATTTFKTVALDVQTSGVTAEKNDGTTLTVSGSTATSDTHQVTSYAPVVSLKSFTVNWTRNAQESTGTLSGYLEVDVTARGGDVYISKTADTSFVIGKVPSSGASSTVVTTYYDGVPSGVDSSHPSYYKIAKDQTATFKVKTTDTFVHDGKAYYLTTGINGTYYIRWFKDTSGTAGTDLGFFNSDVWRSGTVSAN